MVDVGVVPWLVLSVLVVVLAPSPSSASFTPSVPPIIFSVRHRFVPRLLSTTGEGLVRVEDVGVAMGGAQMGFDRGLSEVPGMIGLRFGS